MQPSYKSPGEKSPDTSQHVLRVAFSGLITCELPKGFMTLNELTPLKAKPQFEHDNLKRRDTPDPHLHLTCHLHKISTLMCEAEECKRRFDKNNS